MSGLDEQRWGRLWEGHADLSACRRIFSELEARYAKPQRQYHNSRHIGECLAEFDRVVDFTAAPRMVELAIWFHDAVYDPRAPDNEERSAEFVRSNLGPLGCDAELIDGVAKLVLATKRHETSFHTEAPLLVDVDLSIFGQPVERFWEYEAQIRAEYSWVTERTFAEKRAEILAGFLSRPRIYHTEPMFRRFEQRARENLHASIRRLSRS